MSGSNNISPDIHKNAHYNVIISPLQLIHRQEISISKDTETKYLLSLIFYTVIRTSVISGQHPHLENEDPTWKNAWRKNRKQEKEQLLSTNKTFQTQ